MPARWLKLNFLEMALYTFCWLCSVLLLVSAKSDKKVSFTFVIDNTKSMGDDIEGVKVASNRIIDAIASTGSAVIENYVLVTFNDPDIKKWVVTSDSDELKKSLGQVVLENIANYDCDEMSLKGIELALKESLPGSFLYVFTDAGAKDRANVDRVRNLAISKQCQIIFVITGTCEHNPIDPVYHSLAKSTNGHVFKGHKADVDEVLNYAVESVKTKRRVIESFTLPPGYDNKFNVTIDGTTLDLIFAFTGTDTASSISKPDGGKAVTETVVNLPDSKVIKLNVTSPGDYGVTAGSKSETAVLIQADTNVDFIHGFSITKPKSIVGASIMPLPDVKSFLAIQLKTDEDIILHTVELSDLENKIITEIPLEKLNAKCYATDKFLPPTGLFQITIKGFHPKSKTNIRRKSATVIEFQDVDLVSKEIMPPEMEIDKGLVITADYDEPLTISCNVKGYPKPEIEWFDVLGNKVSDEVIAIELPYDYKNILEIEHANKNTTYECKASNLYGAVNKTVKIKTKPKFYFKVLVKPTDLKVEYKKSAKVLCKVDSYPSSKISWTKDDKDLQTDENIEISNDGSIFKIKTMAPELNGTYCCIVENGFNSTAFYFNTLLIGVAPTINIETGSSLKAEYNEPINLECKVTGFPQPTIIWKDVVSGSVLPSTSVASVEKDYDLVSILHIEQSKENSTFQCNASNDKGENNKTVEVETRVHMKFINRPTDTSIEFKKDDVVICKVDANPPATITWHKDGMLLRSDDNLNILYRTDGSSALSVIEMKPHLVGNYSCKARNEFQTEVVNFNVMIIGTAPQVIVQGTPKINVEYNEHQFLLCQVSGYPEPDILWQNKDTGEEFVPAHWSAPPPYDYGRVLQIDRVNKNTTYTCKANNSLGSDSNDIKVETIRNIYFDVLEHPKNTEIKYKANGEVYCKVDASPRADIKWYGRGTLLRNGTHIKIAQNGTILSIQNMQPNLSGPYLCRALNKNNETNLHFQISITGIILPKINKTNSNLIVMEGYKTNITCSIVRGDPIPVTAWYYKKDDEKRFHKIEETRNKIILNGVTRAQSGAYRCIASNVGGRDIFRTDLTVEYPPTIELKKKRTIKLKHGEKEILKCTSYGMPKPEVTWLLNDTPANAPDYEIYKDNSIMVKGSLKNNGKFTCLAKNKHGEANTTIEVIYIVPVIIEIPLESKIESLEGDKVEMPCIADGFPAPSIKWLYFDVNSTAPKLLRTAMSPDIIFIKSVELERAGFYMCIASNDGSSYNITYEVIVNAPPKIIVVPSYILTAVVGDFALRIPCNATGWPVPVIQWIRNGNSIASGTIWHEIVDDGTLLLKKLDQGGTYICKATNSFGTDTKQYKVNLVDFPEPVPPSSTVTIPNSDPARIQCNIPHTPVDQLRWYKEDKLIAEGELTINNANSADSGLYSCRVSTFVGTETSSVMVTWTFNGKTMDFRKMLMDFEMSAKTAGTYTSLVKNRLGRINKTIEIISVWTGSSGQLKLPNADAVPVNVTLSDTRGHQQVVPQYLWKVVQMPETQSSVAIVQLNIYRVKLLEALGHIFCQDICRDIPWMDSVHWKDPAEDFTYCRTLKESERAFGYGGHFGDNMNVLYGYSLLSESTA